MDLREFSRLLYQIKLANQKVATSFEQETGFSLTRYEMLMIVKEKQACSQTEIQQEMKIDNAAITRHLKILEEEGYVRRERNQANNREVFVHLTEHANQALTTCDHKHTQADHLVSQVLSEEEIKQLSSLLEKLNKI